MQGDVQLYAGAVLVMGAVLLGLWFLLGDKILGKKEHAEGAELSKTSVFKEAAVKDNKSRMDRTRGSFAEATTKKIERVRFGAKLSRNLERAGSNLRPGEYMLAVVAFVSVVTLFFLIWRGPITGILAGVMAMFFASRRLKKRLKKRQSQFADQLPDLLQMLATNLRAGQSLNQAVNSIAQESQTPSKEELQRVVIEQRIGRDLTASFKDLSDRMDSQDFEWVVAAIDINRTVGGDLATILGRVESTIRARNRIRGQVEAMSAEGKLSGGVLIALPPSLMLIVSVINPGYMDPMFETFIGKCLLGLAFVMLATGGFWLKKIAEFEY